MKKIGTVGTFLSALVVASTLLSQTYTIQPELIDTISLEDYRRIWGSPDGAVFFQKQSGIEIRRYPGTENRKINYRANQKLISSDRGRYYALVTYSSLEPSQLDVAAISLYDYSGQEIWTAENPGCNVFVLCDNLPVAVGISVSEGRASTRLSFFNESGQLVGSAKADNFYSGRFSTGGQYFFGIVGGELVKYSGVGKEVHNYGTATQYFVGIDASHVAVVRDTVTQIFSDSILEASWPTKSQQIRDIRFSRDSHLSAILYVDRLSIYDLHQRTMLAEHTLDDAAFRFFHFDADPDFTYFICGASNSADSPEFTNTKGLVLLLGSQGEVLWGEQVSYDDWSVRYPDVRIDASNRLVTLLTPSLFQVYRF